MTPVRGERSERAEGEPWHVSFDVEGEQIPIDQLPTHWDAPGYLPHEFDDGSFLIQSEARVVVEDRLLPQVVGFKLPLTASHVPGEPWIFGGISVRDGSPQMFRLEFSSDENGREIRQSDLRAIEINTFVVDLMAALSLRVDQSDPDETVFHADLPGEEGPGEAFTAARHFIERRRRRPGLREITPELLGRVAEVYRHNINHAPTEAVAKAFGVKQRMASTYVQRARTAGFLPPTKQGKKKA